MALWAGLCGCAADNHVGAAVVRWRLALSSTGVSVAGCQLVDSSSFVAVAVDDMALVAQRLDVAAEPLTFPFRCGPTEGTTPFTIPTGTYAFSLHALACGGSLPVGYAPPPQVRDVRAGEVTNLNAVEILIPPCTSPQCLGGDASLAGSCSDAQ